MRVRDGGEMRRVRVREGERYDAKDVRGGGEEKGKGEGGGRGKGSKDG